MYLINQVNPKKEEEKKSKVSIWDTDTSHIRMSL